MSVKRGLERSQNKRFAAVQLFFILAAKTVIEMTVVQTSSINNIVAAWLDPYNYHIAIEHITHVNINT